MPIRCADWDSIRLPRQRHSSPLVDVTGLVICFSVALVVCGERYYETQNRHRRRMPHKVSGVSTPAAAGGETQLHGNGDAREDSGVVLLSASFFLMALSEIIRPVTIEVSLCDEVPRLAAVALMFAALRCSSSTPRIASRTESERLLRDDFRTTRNSCLPPMF
jgi:hypothetical protein